MRRVHHQFGLVLILIVLTLAVLLASPDGDAARVVTVALQAATLVAAVDVSRSPEWVVRATALLLLVLLAGSIAAALGTDEFGGDSSRVVGLLLAVLAPTALVLGLVRQLRIDGGITIHTMFGVLCLYLLIGIVFAEAFIVIEEVGGTRFFASGADNTADFLYFSFATLTTVGYGDLVAATNLGRSLAITEALMGQIYLVTVVALIVTNLGPAARARRRVGRGASRQAG